MIRRMTLATALLFGACGDDSDTKTKEKEDAGQGVRTDAGPVTAADAAVDAEPAVTPDLVTNVGEACRSANACEGGKPSCQTMLSLLGQEVPFPGGYCSTPCQDNRECGKEGECPVGESLKAIPATFRGLLGGAAPSHCYARCTKDADCRTDEKYRCATIVTALSEGAGSAGLNIAGLDVSTLLSGPIVESKYCLPPAPEVPDAGPAIVDAGQSAAQDAGAADAAADAADADAGEAGGDV
jgi:hypothetical protein